MTSQARTQVAPETTPAAAPKKPERACACGKAAGVTGQCSPCATAERLGVQPKLRINPPGDRWEQEADRIAEQVVSEPRPALRGPLPVTPLTQQRDAPEEGTAEQESAAGCPTGEGFASDLAAEARGGERLSEDALNYFEPRFGRGLADVRIHKGLRSQKLTRDIGARAFTIGKHVYLSEETSASEEKPYLLGHEIAHTLQQSPSLEPAEGIAPGAHRTNPGGGSGSIQRQTKTAPKRADPASRSVTMAPMSITGEDRSELVRTKLRPSSPGESRQAVPLPEERPEIAHGVYMLDQHTVGDALRAVARWREAQRVGITGVQASAPDLRLREVTENILYLSNRMYVLDTNGNMVRGGFNYTYEGTTFEPGGVYFLGHYLLGDPRESGDVELKGQQFAALRLEDSAINVEGGEIPASRFILRRLQKEHLQEARRGVSGVGLIVSSEIASTTKAPSLWEATTKIARAVRGSKEFVKWAARERLEEARENPTQEIVELLVDAALERLPKVLGKSINAYEQGKLGVWMANVANIAANARNESELSLASQEIARVLVEQAWSELKEKGVSPEGSSISRAGGSSRTTSGGKDKSEMEAESNRKVAEETHQELKRGELEAENEAVRRRIREKQRREQGETQDAEEDRRVETGKAEEGREKPDEYFIKKTKEVRPPRITQESGVDRLSKGAQNWLSKNFKDSTWRESLKSVNEDIIHAVEIFKNREGFDKVMSNYFVGSGTAPHEGARFVLQFSLHRLRNKETVVFEMRSVKGARYADIVADSKRYELKNVQEVRREHVFGDSSSDGPWGGLGQFLKDLSRDNVAWVFNKNKIADKDVIVNDLASYVRETYREDPELRGESLKAHIRNIVMLVNVNEESD